MARIILSLTPSELIALTDILDSFSIISEGIEDDGISKKDLKKLDKMLLRHGYKRQYK